MLQYGHMPRKRPPPTEYQDQCALVAWLTLYRLRFTAIPNSTYTTSWKQKHRNHASGLRAGLPDLLIVLPDRLLFVEMKRLGLSPSVVKPEQHEWIDALNGIPNVRAIVCYGYAAAVKAIEAELKSVKK